MSPTLRDRDAPPLPRAQWRRRAADHEDRIRALIGPYLQARRRGEKHPVIDFLFTYYNTRPGQLLRWHPGYPTALADAADYAGLAGYRTRPDGAVAVDEACLRHRRELLDSIAALLAATAARPPRFGCFGLHEWAMVYRTDTPRHALPLRLGRAGTDAVVESRPLHCTHYDAFRFFTEPAQPRNTVALSRAHQLDNEQPGCLHATMDLYRYCLRLTPLLPGELLADAFELALAARVLDMRASPYDLTALGYTPVPIETPADRAEYIAGQTAIADRGTALRRELLTACETLLTTARTGGNRFDTAE